MKLFKREKYLKKMRGFFHDTEMIKVITGVRRCGKSSLMQTIAEELKLANISDDNIVFLDLDKEEFKNIKTSDDFREVVQLHSKAKGIKYFFIDEIQNVPNFEIILNALRLKGDYSFFITGSNSYLLSGELITKLTGRYIEFEMLPLTFDEYLEMKSFYGKEVSSDLTLELDKYLIEGGFPKTIFYDDLEDKKTYIKSVITEIFEKDIKRRVKIKNASVFQQVQNYIINNFGATTNLTNVITVLHKQGINIKRETLNRYLEILKDSKIIQECNRFDLKSKRAINGEQKYYLVDLGFYYASNTDNRINYGPVLENVLYNYLRSYNYAISIGRIGKLECDFILRRGSFEYSYIQVAMTIMLDRATEDREYTPLENIADNYPKYIITRNDPIQHRNGIIHLNLPKMMQEKFLP